MNKTIELNYFITMLTLDHTHQLKVNIAVELDKEFSLRL